jgi:hypothetical protein
MSGKRVFLLFFLMLGSGNLYADIDTEVLSLYFKIKPVLVMKVSSDTGGSLVDFGPVLTTGASRSPSLTIEVITNTDSPYRIYQWLKRPVMNDDGQTPAKDQMMFRVGDGQYGGQSKLKERSPLDATEVMIFQSGPLGGSDSFRIDFDLGDKTLMHAGEYFGDLRFRLERL